MFPQHAVTRTVSLKFAGQELRFHLSHALFSSNRIDDGTVLLLKTLAQQKAVPATGAALDAGCGAGPLAVALALHQSGLAVTATDRLALAVAFTSENARLNGAKLTAVTALLLGGEVPAGGWNLIVSNLPAKAGEPVLHDFFPRALSQLAPGGRVAVVVVSSLVAAARLALDECGAVLLYHEETAAYQVFHFGAGHKAPASLPDLFPAVYLRGWMEFSVGKQDLRQKTFFGLPNFDALDYRWQVSEKFLVAIPRKVAALLVWEPGQGQMAAFLASGLSSGATLHLAGNDLLALLASRSAAAASGTQVTALHCVDGLRELPARIGEVQGAVIQVHSHPEVPWVDEVCHALLDLLPPGAPVLLNGTSTDLSRFLEKHKGLRKVQDQKYRGWRSALLVRS